MNKCTCVHKSLQDEGSKQMHTSVHVIFHHTAWVFEDNDVREPTAI